MVLYAGVHGGPSSSISINPNDIHYGEMSIVGSNSKTRQEFSTALELISKADLRLTDLITDRYLLSEINTGIRAVAEQETIKAMVKPQE